MKKALVPWLMGAASHTEARKRLVDEHGHQVQQPSVRGDACDQVCFFQNDLNSWCFDTESPIVEIGWTYVQTYNSIETLAGDTLNYFQVAWEPYAQGFGKIKSIFDIQRLYYNEFTAELKEFRL